MLLQISTHTEHATDLGFLLHKHPDRMHSFTLSFGQAHVFYPVAEPNKCTAVLWVEVDPVGLVRRDNEASLAQYVNDRPYVASSFLSVAIAQVYGTALSGRCKTHPELVDQQWAFEIKITNLPCRGGFSIVERLFTPLGYAVAGEPLLLDPQFPHWGYAHYFTITMQGKQRLTDLLSHLYVLIPVLDTEKHYYVGDEEVAKLLRHGEGWLIHHPDKTLITERYLKRKRSLVRQALERLVPEETEDESDRAEEEEVVIERPLSLHQRRLDRVTEVLIASGVTTVCDAGCGDGKLLSRLMSKKQFSKILGIDVSWRSLETAQRRLHVEQMSERQRQRLTLAQGALTYRDQRMHDYEAFTLIEVIEHMEVDRLPALERVVFGEAHPYWVIITTPNSEYNVRFTGLAEGAFRHRDHRFEWNRHQFDTWCKKIGETYGYTVDIQPIGDIDPEVGAPCQMGVFQHD